MMAALGRSSPLFIVSSDEHEADSMVIAVHIAEISMSFVFIDFAF